MDTTTLHNWHLKNKEKHLSGRYITAEMIAPLLENLPSILKVETLGFSVQNRPIHSLQIGTGKTRVLMWSQMHGNESTSTKAIFDLLRASQDSSLTAFSLLLEEVTLCIIPILNPDGAHAYTRNNANEVDLNRDAQTLSQPESKVLRALFYDFKPDICFNLHGQRTIYGFEETGKPSVLSFLSPSADEERSITLSRKRSMSIITSIFNDLKGILPGQIGRYDDGFNLNCVGDTFQNEGVPTLLFEAGHAQDDYTRENCRGYMFLAIVSALQGIVTRKTWEPEDYFKIPEHQKCYCDILLKNSSEGDVGIQYKEVLDKETIRFVSLLSASQDTTAQYGHKVIDLKGGVLTIDFENTDDNIANILGISTNYGVAITL
jgi:hypothetical protein